MVKLKGFFNQILKNLKQKNHQKMVSFCWRRKREALRCLFLRPLLRFPKKLHCSRFRSPLCFAFRLLQRTPQNLSPLQPHQNKKVLTRPKLKKSIRLKFILLISIIQAKNSRYNTNTL